MRATYSKLAWDVQAALAVNDIPAAIKANSELVVLLHLNMIRDARSKAEP